MKKIVWLLVSCLMVVALVLASCGPAEEEEEEVTPPPPSEEEEEVTPPVEEEEEEQTGMVKVSLTKLDGSKMEKLIEEPQYGGEFRIVWSTSPQYFDDAYGHCWFAPTTSFTNECLLQGNWAIGPAGTDEVGWRYEMTPEPHVIAGMLAESWELTDPTTIKLTIRQGIHFQNKPPVNGRELDADDVVASLRRLWQTAPKSVQRFTLMPESTFPDVAEDGTINSIYAPDKWTVICETLPGTTGLFFELATMQAIIFPREALEQYPDMNDWENAVGTGPFFLTDYVKDASITLERNPSYWMKDPIMPQNTLPYLDTVKWLIIPDLSTRLTALRTGKGDWSGMFGGVIEWEDAQSLIKTNPDLKYQKVLAQSAPAIKWRVDKPELPWYDLKVRRALTMAINQQEIKDQFYQGNAEIMAYPVAPLKEFDDIYIPLDEMPASVQELFQYQPDKAKQLLAEAGYPDGFKADLVIYSAQSDLASLVKAYWEKIGVDLNIQVKEYGAYVSIFYGKKVEQMIMEGCRTQVIFRVCDIVPWEQWDAGMIDDPVINEAYQGIKANYFDTDKKHALYKGIVPHVLDQAVLLQLPASYRYNFWQPWVKGYHGEFMVGYYGVEFGFPRYIWVDQVLKKNMGK